MSRGFQLESIIKANYFDNKPNEDSLNEEEVRSSNGENDSFEVIDSTSERADSDRAMQQEKKEELMGKIRDFGDSFEHLSQYDPDDEFLKSSRSLSIIESIVGKQGRASSALSESSEFSIISANNVKSVISSLLSDVKSQALR